MVTGGNATVYISNMDRAIAFYTGVLGMKIVDHYGDHWSTVEAGGFTIGLHPQDSKTPVPGTHGAIQVGLTVLSIDDARAKLITGGGQEVGPVVEGSGGSFVHFHDLDGNALYLWQMPKFD